MDGIDPEVIKWIAEQRPICVYGGEDIEWIRKFTTNARAVAQQAGIVIELVFVGKSNPGEQVRKNIATINLEKLGYCMQDDLTSISFFWVRIQSMWHSKMKLGNTIENDPIMKEIRKILDWDGSGEGWAIFSNTETAEIAKSNGETIANK
ncbi:hypothetical protein MKX01_028387 [Papaver californicum]|nr:hypothetical protein MKX01_028387 [Papaver californicum]